jgi:hypothetical protein
MAHTTHSDPGLRSATEQRKAVRDFAYHLIVFVFVIGLMAVLDVRAGTGPDAVFGLDWAYWIALFWGVGLAGHGVWAFLGDSRP